MDWKPGPHDRITHDGDRLDEVVMTDVDVHIEALNWHTYWCGIKLPDGRRVTLHFANAFIVEDDARGVPHKDGPALLYGCPAKWFRTNVEHACEIGGEHTRHRCECGSTNGETK